MTRRHIKIYFLSPGSPRVSQVCGVMQRAPPPHVSLVDIGSILEQKLAGDQRTLKIKDAGQMKDIKARSVRSSGEDSR